MIEELIIKAVERLESKYKAPHYGDNALSVTMCCGCVRASYFSLKLPKPKEDYESVYKKLYGKLLHRELLAEIAKEIGGEVDKRIELDVDGIKVVGYADLVAKDTVLELKTCYKLPNKPNNAHLMQLNAYLAGLGRAYGWLIYVHRDSGRYKVFRHEFSQSLHECFIANVKLLTSALESDSAPKVDERLMSRLGFCHSCPYWQYCKNDRKARKPTKQLKLFRLKVNLLL
jgi:CRISPR/Cas system-associated exonuclease Cas4 (RecB family)